MQRNSKPLPWRAHTLSDTEDASSVPSGSMASLMNLIPDPQSAKLWYCRPAAILNVNLNSAANQAAFLAEYGSSLYSSSGYISVLYIVGDIAYGMIAGGKGSDLPFIWNLATSTLSFPSGVTSSNVPASPTTSGAWTPPQMALIGANIILTHSGFSGAVGAFFGVLNVVNATWTAQNLTGLVSFVTVPTAVAQFNGRAYYITNNPAQPAVVFSDVLNATNCTNANQVLTFGDTAKLTALAGLPLFNVLGGVIQALIVFKGVANVYQITGDASASGGISINALNLGTGTMAPRSIVTTPKGLAFTSPDGLRFIDFYAKISDPVGFDGQGVTSPFSQSVTPSRISAVCNGSLLRITTQNSAIAGSPTYEYWYDVTRQIWSGPHTCISVMAQPWRGTFIIAPTNTTGALYESDPIQSDTSTFTEFGSALTWTWQTPLLPDLDEMTNNCMTEGTLDLAFQAGGSVTAFFSDQNGTVIDSVTMTASGTATLWGAFTWGTGIWGGAANALAPIQLQWHLPIVFVRGSFMAQGTSSEETRIGALHMRYQPLRTWVNTSAAA